MKRNVTALYGRSERHVGATGAAPLRQALYQAMLLALVAVPMSGRADPGASGGGATEFDSSLLVGNSARSIDVKRYRYGNPMMAGAHRVDVTLNGTFVVRETITFVDTLDTGSAVPCLPVALLERMGVVVDPSAGTGTECVDLERVHDAASFRFDSATQVLALSVPQVALSTRPRGVTAPADWDHGVNAALLNYTLSSFHDDSGGSSSFLGLNAGVNLGAWRFRQRYALSNDRQGTNWNSLSAYAQRDIPSLRSQLVVGDSFTTGQIFDSIGFRGVSLASDERMLPQSLRGYAPTLRGVAASQARVQVWQSGNLIYETSVAPGPFEITDLYSTGYGGDLRLMVTESDGTTKTSEVPFSAVAQLLRPGATRFAATVGELREADSAHDSHMGELTLQHGVNNWLTAYGGAQYSNIGYRSAVVGLAVSTMAGAIALDTTFSRSDLDDWGGARQHSGSSTRLTYSNYLTTTGTNVSLAAYRYSTDGFRSLSETVDLAARRRKPSASGDDAWEDIGAVSRNRLQVNINQALAGGSLFASASTQDYWDRPGRDLQYNLGYSRRFARVDVSAAASRVRLGDGSWDDQFSLNASIPLGSDEGRRAPQLTLGLDKQQQASPSMRAGVAGSLGEQGKYGYSGRLSRVAGSSELNVGGSYAGGGGSMSAAYSRRSSGTNTFSVGASGGLLVVKDSVVLAPHLGDTVGLVEAKGATGAQLNLGANVQVGRGGYAVAPFMTPYEYNHVALDPEGASLDFELASSSQRVAPTAGAVVKVMFEVERGRAAVINLRHLDGKPLPFGVDAFQGEKMVGVVGQGSRLLARVGADAGTLRIEWKDADGLPSVCHIDYRLPAATAQSAMPVVAGTCRP